MRLYKEVRDNKFYLVTKDQYELIQQELQDKRLDDIRDINPKFRVLGKESRMNVKSDWKPINNNLVRLKVFELEEQAVKLT